MTPEIMNTRKHRITARGAIVVVSLAWCSGLQAQVLISNDGGTNTVGGNTISWSMGEPIIGTGSTTSGAMTQGYQQPTGKLIYYSRATGNVSDPIWSRTPTGPAGPANFIPRASMVVQTGDVVTNTGTVDLRDLLVETGGDLQLANGSFFNIHGRNVTFVGTVYGSEGGTMSLVCNKPVVFTAISKPDLWDLQVTTPQGTTASGEVIVRGTLQLNEGDLDATGAIFSLQSLATTTGRLGPVPPEASYTGHLRIERYIPGGATNWRLLGSPIMDRTVQHWQDDFITAGYPGSHYPNFDNPVGSGILWPSIRWYNEPNTGALQLDGMTGVSSNTQPLAPGQGFAVWCGDALGGTAPFVVDLGGAPPVIAMTPLALPMSWTDTGNPEVDGWNVVSNPLPSAIAFDRIARGADVEDYVTFYNPANGNTAVYDLGLGYGTNSATNTIQSSQGFWLKATGAAVTTTVDEGDKINDNGGGIFGGLMPPEPVPMVRLHLSSSVNTYNDETLIAFSTGTPEQDAEDALKYVFAHNAAPQVATLGPTGTAFAINAFGAASSAMSIPVSVNAGVNGTYTLAVTTQGELGVSCLGLEDLVTGALIPIIDGMATYAFALVASAPAETRFLLRVLDPQAAFTAPTTVEVNTPVAFNNTSVDGMSFAWDFGDGTTSTEPMPTYTYTLGGSFTVSLTVTTGDCSSTLTHLVEVTSPALPLRAKVLLQGAFDAASDLMRDDLRTAGLLPLVEPYTALGLVPDNTEASTWPAVLAVSGNDAIVDWVLVELRSADDAATVVGAQAALVQRDGDVVGMDGNGAVFFPQAPDNYHIAVRHRNHFGVMTRLPLAMNASTTLLDLTVDGSDTYGTGACTPLGGTPGRQGLWAGDVTGDGTLKYTGADNDRDPILTAIGGTVPTNTITGYRSEDVNMDGIVKYTGPNNDRDPILMNIGGVVPTNTRVEQLP